MFVRKLLKNFNRQIHGHRLRISGIYCLNSSKNKQTFHKIIAAAGTQFNIHIAQRLRRLHKVYILYQQAYKEYARVYLFYPLIGRFVFNSYVSVSLTACGFQFQQLGFSDSEISKQIHQLLAVQKVSDCDSNHASTLVDKSWHIVLNESNIRMWKHHRNDLGLTEYRVHGTFNDIPARLFFNIQVDMEYRKAWDDLVVKLDVIEDDKDTKDQQVLQWVTRLPRPFAPREYLCIRRTLIDEQNKVMLISAKAVNHPSCQPSKDYVRVSSYESHMVIKPHKSFDDLGFDYLLTYCDDPQIVLPTTLASWVISAGIPQYINKLHDACIQFRCKTSSSKQNVNKYLVS